ncbi:MAG TPA: bifunctional diaminohydroxyphosphoribosylaminopyrimidine deaminase/5-amino-6-(5-phosphoribosylamino)uracil reductase RibD [Ignavibacteriaceae bacterium]|nr:bifunctional diaminohydroxyphosphoribosylaminopyrimidine deaminase/5-amino-6-(5-phosphoribosylamino)uracil reductase RibD [Ignavibacteriaceae bacterium]
MTDESYIQLALEIARKGIGAVSPNPLVGCILVKDDRIIGAGYHEKFGANHAEINAIENAKESVDGSTLFINLEPCSHFGKTPPCVEKIIDNKIKKVVIGTLDMNPLVSGNGVKKLKSAGIDVKVGVLEKECIDLNKFFFKYITNKIPYVTLKAAQTLDGKIADLNGGSRWISSMESRKFVHHLRANYDAVLVGAGTVEKDNPSLTVRLTDGRNPRRIILDNALNLNIEKRLFAKNNDHKTILVTSKDNENKKKVKNLKSIGVKVLFARTDKDGNLNLKSVLKELAKNQIASVLVEGGSRIFSSFIKCGLYDDIYLFISPKIIGSGIPVVENIGVKSIKKTLKVKIKNYECKGEDLMLKLEK